MTKPSTGRSRGPKTRTISQTGVDVTNEPQPETERPIAPPEPETVIVVPRTEQTTVIVPSRAMGVAPTSPEKKPAKKPEE